jgi:hypothetical protein
MSEREDEQESGGEPEGEEREELGQRGRIQQTEQEEGDEPEAA